MIIAWGLPQRHRDTEDGDITSDAQLDVADAGTACVPLLRDWICAQALRVGAGEAGAWAGGHAAGAALGAFVGLVAGDI
jgi:hypothetical protein